MPTGYATRSLAPQSWQHPEDIELVFNGAKGGLGYSEARCGVSRIRGDAKWSLITVDEPCWTNLKKGYDAEFAGLVPAAPTDVENSLSLLRKRGSWFYSGGKGLRRMPGQVAFQAAERISIERSRFRHLGGLALVLSSVGSNNTVRGNVVHHAGGTGIYPDVGADWVTLERNVLYGSDDAVSGVEPKRIRIANNHWDDDKPFWWPDDTPTDGITLAGNTLLARANPASSCRADAACAGILVAAGRR